MACQSCGQNAIQFNCGDAPRLICLQSQTDPTPVPAWASPVCVAGELVGIALFSNEAGTTPLLGYTIADRVPCPESLLGLSCAASVKADLCQSSLSSIEVIVNTQTASLQQTMLITASNMYGKLDQVTAEVTEQGEAIIAAIEADNINYSYALEYTDGNLTKITRTNPTSGASEEQTLAYVSDALTAISSWVAIP